MKIQSGHVATPPDLNAVDRGGVKLLSAPRPLPESSVQTLTPHEARDAFRTMAAKATDTLGRAGGVPAETLSLLRDSIGELSASVNAPSLTVAQIKAATQAASQIGVATQLCEPNMAHELSPNDFARTLVSHAGAMEKQARAMAADPALAAVAPLLQDAAQSLRRSVQENYLASGHMEAFSAKEAANFRALHYEAGGSVLDGVIARLKEDLALPGLTPGDAQMIKNQISGIQQYKDELRSQADNFRSDKYQDNADKTADRKSIRKMMGGSLHRFELKKIAHLRELVGVKLRKSGLERAGRHGKPLPDSFGKVHLKSAMAAHMRGRLQALGLNPVDIPSTAKMREAIGDAYKNGVQMQPWKNIERTHAMLAGGAEGAARQVSFDNRITRARDLSPELSASYAADGIEGVSSLANKESRHAVNLWHTEYRPSADAGFAFSAIRHGIHDAYKIKDPVLREAANDARVDEFIRASIVTADPSRLTRNADGTLSLDIVSVSLVTPAADEKKMLANQVAAYERANERYGQQGIEVRLPQPDGSFRTERVKPNIVAFNAGVNSFSLGALSPIAGGWGPSDRLNNASVKALVGDLGSGGALGGLAGRKLAQLREQLQDPAQAAQHPHLQRKLEVIQDLATQVTTILREKSHHSAGNEPYKLPVRLLALANECGAASAFNCKSGKDRTGQLDVEIKDFYTDLNLKDTTRPVDYKRTATENLNLKTLFEHGGGREIQKHNTGVPGSKVDLKVFYNLFQFTSDKVDELKGLSKWVGA